MSGDANTMQDLKNRTKIDLSSSLESFLSHAVLIVLHFLDFKMKHTQSGYYSSKHQTQCLYFRQVSTSHHLEISVYRILFLDLFTFIIFDEEYKLHPPYAIFSFNLLGPFLFLGPNILLGSFLSNTLILCSFLRVTNQISHPKAYKFTRSNLCLMSVTYFI